MRQTHSSRRFSLLRRLLTLCLVLVFLSSLCSTAFAVSATASDMRLVSASGSVSLKNSSGKGCPCGPI